MWSAKRWQTGDMLQPEQQQQHQRRQRRRPAASHYERIHRNRQRCREATTTRWEQKKNQVKKAGIQVTRQGDTLCCAGNPGTNTINISPNMHACLSIYRSAVWNLLNLCYLCYPTLYTLCSQAYTNLRFLYYIHHLHSPIIPYIYKHNDQLCRTHTHTERTVSSAKRPPRAHWQHLANGLRAKTH